MAERLDPKLIFDLIASHLPPDLRPHILVVGSLAAAYHFRDVLEFGSVTTKDADVVIQPAGAIAECVAIAKRLLDLQWHLRIEKFRPCPSPDGDLPAIRLSPPDSNAYFIELLGFPDPGQVELKTWIPVELEDGWYGLPSFRFLGLTAHAPLRTQKQLTYAAPSMMALANLLSHSVLGTDRMSEPIGGRSLLRSAKDLGRVLALARLSSRAEVETWPTQWASALRATFPTEYPELARRAGDGLRELLRTGAALEQARHAVDVGLLAGFRITTEQLQRIGQQLLVDAIDPLLLDCDQ